MTSSNGSKFINLFEKLKNDSNKFWYIDYEDYSDNKNNEDNEDNFDFNKYVFGITFILESDKMEKLDDVILLLSILYEIKKYYCEEDDTYEIEIRFSDRKNSIEVFELLNS